MHNVMATLPNVGGALCSTLQTLADAHYAHYGVPCSNAAKTRNPLKLAGVPQTNETISLPLAGRTSPHCRNVWGRYCCLTSFSPIVDTCLNCEDIARQSCAMVSRWRIFDDFFGSAFPACCMQQISDLHSKFALECPHHV